MISQDRITLKILIARIQLFESYEVISNRSIVCVDNEVITFTRHKIQRVCYSGFDVADFSCNDCEIMIFDLHQKRTNIYAGVDKSEAVFATLFDVKNCNRCKL